MKVFEGDPRLADTDLVIVSVFEGETSVLAPWTSASNSEIDRAIASKELCGKLYETFVTPIAGSGVQARRLAVIGLGKQG